MTSDLNQPNLIDGEGVIDAQSKGLKEQRRLRRLKRAAPAQETTTDLSLMAACLSFSWQLLDSAASPELWCEDSWYVLRKARRLFALTLLEMNDFDDDRLEADRIRLISFDCLMWSSVLNSWLNRSKLSYALLMIIRILCLQAWSEKGIFCGEGCEKEVVCVE